MKSPLLGGRKGLSEEEAPIELTNRSSAFHLVHIAPANDSRHGIWGQSDLSALGSAQALFQSGVPFDY